MTENEMLARVEEVRQWIRGRRPGDRPNDVPSLTTMLERLYKEAKASLDETVDDALRQAMLTGRSEDIDALLVLLDRMTDVYNDL